MPAIPLRQYPAAYKTILNAARAGPNIGSATTFILVALDVDALAAARLLHELLTADYVNNTIIPIRNWKDLDDLEDRLGAEEVRNLILINLGASEDLAAGLSFLPRTALIHVIDSHRPINLANLFRPHPRASALLRAAETGKGRDRALDDLPEPDEVGVIVWSDDEGEDTRDDLRATFEALQFEPDSGDESSDEDDDSDEEEERRREEEEAEDEEGGSPSAAKRRRGSDEGRGLTKVQRRRYRLKTVKYYAQGTYYGRSVANVVYTLAVQLRRVTEDSVWLAIIGLTHQFSTALIDRSRYDDYLHLLSSEVDRLSSAGPNLDPSGPNDRSVRPSEELRFCLFRHWNLYDSMLHSGYVAGRMMLWKERGQKNLSGMLAKMGYSLQQSKETWAHMDSDLKFRLFANMDALAPEYGLTDLTYPSFIRKSGYRSDISASDAVEGLSAILEAATGVRLDFGNSTGDQPIGAEEWTEGLKRWVEKGEGRERGEAKKQEVGIEERMRNWATRNFWLAWDALGQDTTLLRAALPLSMALHRSVTAQGTYILDKQDVKSFRNYRLAIVKEGPRLDVFRHPATLLRLALWLVDSVRDLIGQGGTDRVWSKSLPFVLASMDQESDSFFVVGVVGAAQFGDVKKNAFAVAFSNAVLSADAHAQGTTFDSSTIVVKKDDFAKFLKKLSLG